MPINYTLYPPNWKTEIVPAIIQRAGNCCEVCGVPNGSFQWRGKKEVIKILPPAKGRKSERRLKVSRTFHYPNKEAAIADGSFIEYQVKIVLTIAHLDHDETNWEVKLERMKAMCQLCHLQYDAVEKFRRAMTPGYYKNRKK